MSVTTKAAKSKRLNLISGSALGALLLLLCSACNWPGAQSRRSDPSLDPGWPKADVPYVEASYRAVRHQAPTVPGAEYVNDDELCLSCHETYTKSFAHNVHRGDGCESCHGPASKHLETRGKEPGLIVGFKTGNPLVMSEVCLKCHEERQCTAGNRWRTSKHAQCNVGCMQCHRGHYNVKPGTPATTEPGATAGAEPPATRLVSATYKMTAADGGYKKPTKNLPSLKGTSHNLAAIAPGICYRCHNDKTDLQRVAGPHQICGPNGFNCTTCHDPHGHVREESRKDLCLSCHNGSPTMAWHSSLHDRAGVACTDCHNPHPKACLTPFVNINHYQVNRPKRLPMSVDEPGACVKCHPRIFALTRLPSHHPIMEGKMICSDCHDPHGQMERNLKAENVNLLCYKCHAEKQGPFAYPHQPVTENCAICHEPHGTVANNLLKQPPAILCLRCHVGHRRLTTNGHPSVPAAAIDTIPGLRQPLYTNCTQCHAQVHGTDVPSPAEPNPRAMLR